MRTGLIEKIDLLEAVDVEAGGFEPRGRRSQSFPDTCPPPPHQPPSDSGSRQYFPRSAPISPFCAIRQRMVRMLSGFTLKIPRFVNSACIAAGDLLRSGPTPSSSRTRLLFSLPESCGPPSVRGALPPSASASTTFSAISNSVFFRCRSPISRSTAATSDRIMSAVLFTTHHVSHSFQPFNDRLISYAQNLSEVITTTEWLAIAGGSRRAKTAKPVECAASQSGGAFQRRIARTRAS